MDDFKFWKSRYIGSKSYSFRFNFAYDAAFPFRKELMLLYVNVVLYFILLMSQKMYILFLNING